MINKKKKKIKKIKITCIRNERREITTDPTEREKKSNIGNNNSIYINLIT